MNPFANPFVLKWNEMEWPDPFANAFANPFILKWNGMEWPDPFAH